MIKDELKWREVDARHFFSSDNGTMRAWRVVKTYDEIKGVLELCTVCVGLQGLMQREGGRLPTSRTLSAYFDDS